MPFRILFILFAALIAINLVLLSVSAIMNVNLYKKYGKQILIFCSGFIICIVILYTILAILGLD